MREVKIESSLTVYDNYSSFTDIELSLFQSAKEACKRAYAPYSNFYVGAALLMDNGKVITGNNQENAVYPCGLCAERVAIFHASSQYPDKTFQSIAITIDYDRIPIDDIAFPCGSCRQVLFEYESKQPTKIKVYLLGRDEQVTVLNSVEQLLPFGFSDKLLS